MNKVAQEMIGQLSNKEDLVCACMHAQQYACVHTYTHNGIFERKSKIMIFIGKWTQLEIMLSEICKAHIHMACFLSYVEHGIKICLWICAFICVRVGGKQKALSECGDSVALEPM